MHNSVSFVDAVLLAAAFTIVAVAEALPRVLPFSG